MFGSITEKQINLMITAVQTLPPQLLQKLTGLVGGLGRIINVQVASPQGTGAGLTPVFSIGSGGGMKFGPWGSGFSIGRPGIGIGRSRIGGLSLGGGRLGRGGLLGRKLQQDEQEECVPFLKVSWRRGCHVCDLFVVAELKRLVLQHGNPEHSTCEHHGDWCLLGRLKKLVHTGDRADQCLMLR